MTRRTWSPNRKPQPKAYRCAYCGELGHNRATCRSVDWAPVRLKDALATLKAEQHPAEWERLRIVKDALGFIADRQKNTQAGGVARLALEALAWGKQ